MKKAIRPIKPASFASPEEKREYRQKVQEYREKISYTTKDFPKLRKWVIFARNKTSGALFACDYDRLSNDKAYVFSLENSFYWRKLKESNERFSYAVFRNREKEDVHARVDHFLRQFSRKAPNYELFAARVGSKSWPKEAKIVKNGRVKLLLDIDQKRI